MNKLKLVWTLILSVLLLSSCQEELFSGFKKVEAGLPASISLEMDVPAAQTVATRGIYEYENRIENLALVFYERTTPPFRQMVVSLTEADFNKTTPSDDNSDQRAAHVTYTLNKEIQQDVDGQPILSGTYAVYAIANYNSPFCSLGNNIGEFKQKIAGLDEAAFKALMTQNTEQYQFIGKATMPMTGVAENPDNSNHGIGNEIVNIYPEGETSTGTSNEIKISLKRALAHIEVKFQNYTAPDDSIHPAFVPMKYSIIRLPKTSNLFSKGSNPGDNNIGTPAKVTSDPAFTAEESDFLKNNYFSVVGQEFVGATNSFEFFMLENSHANVEEVTAYPQREEWTNFNQNQVTADTDKKFRYAPDCATYVVVEGIYNGTDYSGTTSYTIHLGNFTNSTGHHIGNFNVNRNEYHTYTVTIKSASSVVTESDVKGVETGKAPGAEGTLIRHTQNASRFVLDSHYETVKISFLKKSAKQLADAKDEIVVLLSTPKTWMGAESYIEFSVKLNTKGHIVVTDIYHDKKLTEQELHNLDLNWVHFMKPVTNTDGTFAFPMYKPEKQSQTAPDPNPSNPALPAAGLLDFIKEVFNADPSNQDTQKHCTAVYKTVNGKEQIEITTACFVDEYFYEDMTWPDFVNKSNRILAVVTGKEALRDGNSFEYKNYMFHISQRSIKTVYADNPDINAFGLETWNETGIVEYGLASVPAGITAKNGHANAWTLVEKNLFNETTLMGKVGHTQNIENNTPDIHWFTLDNNVNFDAKIKAYNACMTRNRDENGNGQIDKNELKWYLPTHTQYMTLWLGNEVLSADTRLLTPDAYERFNDQLQKELAAGKKKAAYDFYSKLVYHTGSGAQENKMWIYEGGAFGGGNGEKEKHALRCVRNLKDMTPEDAIDKQPVYGDEPASISSYDPQTRKITLTGIRLYRKNNISSAYTKHEEKEIQNLPPKAFEVDSKDLSKGDVNNKENFRFWVGSDLSVLENSQDVCGRLKGAGWRVPNQRELMLMYLHTPFPQVEGPMWNWSYTHPGYSNPNDVPLPFHVDAYKATSIDHYGDEEKDKNGNVIKKWAHQAYYASSTYGNPLVRAGRPYSILMVDKANSTSTIFNKPEPNVIMTITFNHDGYRVRCVRDAQ